MQALFDVESLDDDAIQKILDIAGVESINPDEAIERSRSNSYLPEGELEKLREALAAGDYEGILIKLRDAPEEITPGEYSSLITLMFKYAKGLEIEERAGLIPITKEEADKYIWNEGYFENIGPADNAPPSAVVHPTPYSSTEVVGIRSGDLYWLFEDGDDTKYREYENEAQYIIGTQEAQVAAQDIALISGWVNEAIENGELPKTFTLPQDDKEGPQPEAKALTDKQITALWQFYKDNTSDSMSKDEFKAALEDPVGNSAVVRKIVDLFIIEAGIEIEGGTLTVTGDGSQAEAFISDINHIVEAQTISSEMVTFAQWIKAGCPDTYKFVAQSGTRDPPRALTSEERELLWEYYNNNNLGNLSHEEFISLFEDTVRNVGEIKNIWNSYKIAIGIEITGGTDLQVTNQEAVSKFKEEGSLEHRAASGFTALPSAIQYSIDNQYQSQNTLANAYLALTALPSAIQYSIDNQYQSQNTLANAYLALTALPSAIQPI